MPDLETSGVGMRYRLSWAELDPGGSPRKQNLRVSEGLRGQWTTKPGEDGKDGGIHQHSIPLRNWPQTLEICLQLCGPNRQVGLVSRAL